MTTFNDIKQLQLAARKAQMKERTTEGAIAVDLYTTLIGELETQVAGTDKDVSEAMIVATVTKFLKGVNQMIEFNPTNQKSITEKLMLTDLMPNNFLSSADLEVVIRKYIETLESPTVRDMGKVMGFLKSQHAGTYDGKVASDVTKKVLAEGQ